MMHCDRLVLRSPMDRSEPVEISIGGMTDVIFADPPHITPQWRFQHGPDWPRLVDHPQRPWLSEPARLAILALRNGDADQVEFLCRRILQYERPHDDHLAIRTAHFLLAVLEGTGELWAQAAQRLGKLTSNPPRMQACVQNNLAFAECRLGKPEMACQIWLGAVVAYPDCVPAWLSLLNLARVMLDEGAHNVDGLPAWKELENQATAGLQAVPTAVVRSWLNADSVFPGWESVLILQHEKYDSPLSSHLPLPQTGEPAGRALLTNAGVELAGDRPDLALLLANRAGAASPNLAGQSQLIRTQASRRHAQKEKQGEAEQFYRLMRRFDQQLAEMSIANLDAPLATLELMEAIMSDRPALDACRARHRQRAEHLCCDAAEEASGEDRSRWLREAARYGEPGAAGVYLAIAERLEGRAKVAPNMEAPK